MNAPRRDFLATQHAFTAHIRDPDGSPAPSDIDPKRMAVYRELLRNNIHGSLNACFPVLQRMLSPQRWHGLREDFFRRHRCRTPIYRRVPDEFIAYLEHEYESDPNDPPFIVELAHYEWVELALSIDPIEVAMDGVDPAGNLWLGEPCVNPLASLLCYGYPVHRIGADAAGPFAPATTYIVAYRNLKHDVRFMEMNAVGARLFAVLKAQTAATGAEAVAIVAQESQLSNTHALRTAATEVLERLRACEILLGTRAR